MLTKQLPVTVAAVAAESPLAVVTIARRLATVVDCSRDFAPRCEAAAAERLPIAAELLKLLRPARVTPAAETVAEAAADVVVCSTVIAARVAPSATACSTA